MNRQHRILATVAAALRAAVPAVLSDFELGLIDEISARRAELGDEIATISPAEAERLTELVAVMKKHLQDQVADRGRQFGEILGRLKVDMMEAAARLRTNLATRLEETL